MTTSKAMAAKAHRRMVEQPETSSAPEALANELVTRVFVRFQRSLLRYLKDLLRRREDAEDVAQETYVRLVRAAPRDQSEARMRAFMFKVATNLAYDRFRRRRSRGHEDDTELVALPDETPPAERIVAMEQSLELVERALFRLPARCRQVFLLRVSADFSYDAIAERLGVSKRTVEREMQTALEVCQRSLEEGELP